MNYSTYKKFSALLLIPISLFCFSQNNEDYLVQLEENNFDHIKDYKKIVSIANDELVKFNKTKDSIHIIANKFALLYTSEDYMPIFEKFINASELVKINSGKYPIISSKSYEVMSLYLETYSPEMSMYFINEAINNEIKNPHKEFLPHFYHLKGRLLFNAKKYKDALFYFNEALKNYKKDNYLYISSMHNNLGLVYNEEKKLNLAINEFNNSLNFLNEIKDYNENAVELKYIILSNLSKTYFNLNDYKKAQELCEQNFFYYLHNKKDIYISRFLYDVYLKNNDKESLLFYINYLKNNEKSENSFEKKIILTEILADYYKEVNDIGRYNEYHNKLIDLYKKSIDYNQKKFAEVNNYLNETVLNDINFKYNNELLKHKKNTNWIISTGILSLLVLLVSFFTTRLKIKRERKIYHQNNTINEQNKLIMEKNIKLQDEKIKNLHLNLNLKQKTEQAFLEKLKKVRKSKKIDTEEILKELYFDLNNLIGIDKKNIDYSEENKIESDRLKEKLSTLFPYLTAQELQLCVYFRLGLSSKEIAILEKISDGSVRVYKSKIKAKMNIPKEESIENFLNYI